MVVKHTFRRRILVIVLFIGFLGQFHVSAQDNYLLTKEEVLYPIHPPVVGGTKPEDAPAEKIIMWIYEFDLTGDGRDDLLTSSNFYKNGNNGLYAWKVFIQRENGLYESSEKIFMFNPRCCYVRKNIDNSIEFRYMFGLDTGGYLLGIVKYEDGKVVDEVGDEVKDTCDEPFYVFYKEDYKPELKTIPFIEGLKIRANTMGEEVYESAKQYP